MALFTRRSTWPIAGLLEPQNRGWRMEDGRSLEIDPRSSILDLRPFALVRIKATRSTDGLSSASAGGSASRAEPGCGRPVGRSRGSERFGYPHMDRDLIDIADRRRHPGRREPGNLLLVPPACLG